MSELLERAFAKDEITSLRRENQRLSGENKQARMVIMALVRHKSATLRYAEIAAMRPDDMLVREDGPLGDEVTFSFKEAPQ